MSSETKLWRRSYGRTPLSPWRSPDNTTGSDNVASGSFALASGQTASDNVATGYQALQFNTGGSSDVATGFRALQSNNTGVDNVATGAQTLQFNTGGSYNLASGHKALNSNTTGNDNVASGLGALFDNTTGSDNVADGFDALENNTAGSSNVAVGSSAGVLTTGSRNVDIANPGRTGESGTIRIGSNAKQTKAFLAGVWNKTIPGPTKAVVVDAAGRLGTGPAPAAPATSQTVSRLRAQNRRQSDQLRQLRDAVQRLRQQVQNGG